MPAQNNHSQTAGSRENAIDGVRVAAIDRSAAAFRDGIRAGDIITHINGEPIEHELDFSFAIATDMLEIGRVRRGAQKTVLVVRASAQPLGIQLVPKPIARCGNKCIFCFIDQQPRGLRQSLYCKDEDFRHSFLHGNYITMCSMSEKDFATIVRLHLSPLYISVHTTDPVVRTRMLRNRRSGAIRSQLAFLEKNGIQFHAQIVVCPGINDGAVLRRSVADLCRLKNGLLSLAIVPVGLTKYHRSGIQAVSSAQASAIVGSAAQWSETDRKRRGFRRVFVSDEFYIRAGRPIPPRVFYGDYPQIENGVGLVRQLLEEWRHVKKDLHRKKQRISHRSRAATYALATSRDAYPYLKKIAEALCGFFPGVSIDVFPVINRFYGKTVTVAGLLSARDIIHAYRRAGVCTQRLILPHVVFNTRGVTLDGFTAARLSKNAGIQVAVAHTVADIVSIISHGKTKQ